MESVNNELTTEQVFQKSKDLDTHRVGEIIQLMNEQDETVARSVKLALPQIEPAIESIIEVMKAGGKLYYMGAGTSGRLGVLDASECPPTFGVEEDLVTGLIAGGESALKQAIENAEDDEDAGKQEVFTRLSSSDAIVGIASSGVTPYVLGGMKAAKEIGAVTVGLSCNSDTPLSQHVTYPIEVPVGPEILTGSTRLKAGTAQKMVLNMISTTTMIKLGKVYGNLMVNVKATNRKLRHRVIGIVRMATGVDEETAKDITKKASGDARVAILMIKFNVDELNAKKALEDAGGHFREAMDRIEQSNK